MYTTPCKESLNSKANSRRVNGAEAPPKVKSTFLQSIRVYDRTAEQDAAIPPRLPRMRDDDARGGYISPGDREFDSEFFDTNPSKDFRLLSANGGDRRRAALGPLAAGMRGVRLSRVSGFTGSECAVKIVFDWPADRCAELNSANTRRLHELWWGLDDTGSEISDSEGPALIQRDRWRFQSGRAAR